MPETLERNLNLIGCAAIEDVDVIRVLTTLKNQGKLVVDNESYSGLSNDGDEEDGVEFYLPEGNTCFNMHFEIYFINVQS